MNNSKASAMTPRILLLLAALCFVPASHSSQESELCSRYSLTQEQCDYVFEKPPSVLVGSHEIQTYREDLAKSIAAENTAKLNRFLDVPPKKGGAGRAALATLLAATIGIGLGVYVSRRISVNAIGKGAKDTALRWMGFGVMIGIIRFFVAGLSPIFTGVAGAGKGFAEGFVLILVCAPTGYILGYLFGKFRGDTKPEGSADWAGELRVAKPQAQVAAEPTASEMTATQGSDQSRQEVKRPMNEAAIYERIANELETGNTDKGTWTKAYALAEGDDKQTRAKYIKLRFESLSA